MLRAKADLKHRPEKGATHTLLCMGHGNQVVKLFQKVSESNQASLLKVKKG